MSDNPDLGFARFVPGFDFLQNLAKGAGQGLPQMPSLSNWVAPTLNVEELDKRIADLKAVQFWLDQNAKVLAATVQALEVQKMTLSTLQGMNVSMADVANALKVKAGDTMAAFTRPAAADAKADEPQAQASAAPAPQAPGGADPLQWWGALTRQFQQIAAEAMKDAARNTAADTARHMADGMAKDAAKTAAKSAPRPARKASPQTAAKPARKAPARKAAGRTGRSGRTGTGG